MSDLPVLQPGVISIHAIAKVHLPRLELLLRGLAGCSISAPWVPLPGHLLHTLGDVACNDQLVAGEFQFDVESHSINEIASALASVQTLWFEVAQPPTLQDLGQRFCFTPTLGMFHSQLDQAGNQVFGENLLLAAINGAEALNSQLLRQRLAQLMGLEWDAQLEPLRKAALDARYLTEWAS